MNIARLLSERVATRGDHAAIVDNSRGTHRTFTFAQLEAAAVAIAAQLHAAGLRPGDAIVLLQPVSVELYILFIAILRSGLVALFIDPAAGREHIDGCCAVYPPKAFIGCARAHLLRFLSPALRRIPLKFSTDLPVLGARLLNHRQAVTERREIETCTAASPAIIRFTSGSTGQPKAALRSHGFLLEQLRVLERSFGLTAGERDLITMPMFVLSNLAAGVTSVIPQADLRSPGSIPPASLLREIETHRPQRIAAAPALLENLADYCIAHSRTLAGFQKIFTGGAPVFPRLMEKLKSVAPAAALVAVYGSTEAEPIALLDHRQIASADRTRMAAGQGLLAGYPDEAIDLRILPHSQEGPWGRLSDAEFASAGLPAGEPGQVVVAGPHVQPNYLNEPAGSATQLHVHGRTWHQTGDAGYLDALGRLWLLGRCEARIQDHRGILYPFQVEGIALEDPRVRRAALLAHEGRRVLAIESASGWDTGPLSAQLTGMFIDTIKVLRRIPVDRRHNSKIDYPALHSIFRRS